MALVQFQRKRTVSYYVLCGHFLDTFLHTTYLLFTAGKCLYNGKTYSDGESFPDDCNTCQCVNGQAQCTKKTCPQIGKYSALQKKKTRLFGKSSYKMGVFS